MASFIASRLGGVALITGAASGIGRACAQRFVREGCQVVLADKSAANLDRVIKDLDLKPDQYLRSTIDVSDNQAVEELMTSIPQKLGRLDFAINAAGILGEPGTIDQNGPAAFEKVIDVNLRAQSVANKFQAEAMLLPKDPLPSRIAQLAGISEEERLRRITNAAAIKGAIVNLSSVAGYRSAPGIPPGYTISKHGLRGLTKVMATQFGPKGIRTNALAPSIIVTPMVTEGLTGIYQQFLPFVPLGRFGQPEDVADLAFFLCSEEASYINGETVAIDGGFMAG